MLNSIILKLMEELIIPAKLWNINTISPIICSSSNLDLEIQYCLHKIRSMTELGYYYLLSTNAEGTCFNEGSHQVLRVE